MLVKGKGISKTSGTINSDRFGHWSIQFTRQAGKRKGLVFDFPAVVPVKIFFGRKHGTHDYAATRKFKELFNQIS